MTGFNVFSKITLSQTEEDIITKALTDPAVVKYLHMVANEVGQGIVRVGLEGRTPHDYTIAVAREQGKIDILGTLINILELSGGAKTE